jgi:hypothetical protein
VKTNLSEQGSILARTNPPTHPEVVDVAHRSHRFIRLQLSLFKVATQRSQLSCKTQPRGMSRTNQRHISDAE